MSPSSAFLKMLTHRVRAWKIGILLASLISTPYHQSTKNYLSALSVVQYWKQRHKISSIFVIFISLPSSSSLSEKATPWWFHLLLTQYPYFQFFHNIVITVLVPFSLIYCYHLCLNTQLDRKVKPLNTKFSRKFRQLLNGNFQLKNGYKRRP